MKKDSLQSLRIFLYGITGETEAVNAFTDVDQLLDYAEEKGLPFAVNDYNLAEAANVIYLKDIPACFKEDGSVDQQNLENLFVHLKSCLRCPVIRLKRIIRSMDLETTERFPLWIMQWSGYIMISFPLCCRLI